MLGKKTTYDKVKEQAIKVQKMHSFRGFRRKLIIGCHVFLSCMNFSFFASTIVHLPHHCCYLTNQAHVEDMRNVVITISVNNIALK